ncbi:MAG: PTS sugar transporter subunit IIA [Eubacteriales bacterium]
MITDNINIKEQYILIDHEAETQYQALEDLCKPLVEDKVIKKEYVDAVIEREKIWPTGLPTQPIGVAIPHADGKNLVNKSSLAIAVLKEPILFNEAGGSDDKKINVKVIFLISMDSSEGQIAILQALNRLFLDKEYLSKMGCAKSSKEVIGILSKI